MPEIDILIVGAGPAGLLAAYHLSPTHRVMLVERGALGQSTKCWVTTQRRLQKYELTNCALATPSTMTAGSFLGAHISVQGDFAVVDEVQVLETLVGRCRELGVRFLDKCSLLNISWGKQRVRVETTRGSFSTRLVVDASGGMSELARTFRLQYIDGFYSVYGALLQGIHLHTQEIVLGYVSRLGHPPPVIEVFPTGVDSAYCVLFIYSRSLVEPRTLTTAFDDHCNQNPFFEVTDTTKRTAEKIGAIPIGRRRRRVLRGVVPFGEAGLIQPPLMGTAFNELLEHAPLLCRQISRALLRASDKYPSCRLSYPWLKRFQDRVQLPLVRMILDGNVERFDRILRTMSAFPEHLLFNFFSNELTWGQACGLAIRLPWYFMRQRNSQLDMGKERFGE